ncbi:hypothetical protein BDW59DRAFT_40412 [Aspergillus cavernicola]|uniref:Uncharacterized protein n=1 Tax=Aspergillus cavernicola TaxID=176166 RepID=A0ABR4IQ15_9EURO
MLIVAFRLLYGLDDGIIFFFVLFPFDLGSEPTLARCLLYRFGVGTQGGDASGKILFLFISYIPIYFCLFAFFWIVNHVPIDKRDGGDWSPRWSDSMDER